MRRCGAGLLIASFLSIASLFFIAVVEANAQAETAPEPTSEIDTAGQLLAQFGIDEASFGRFVNGEPLDDDQRELLARVLMRLPQIERVNLERWTKRNDDWADVARRSDEYQREFLQIAGRVRKVTLITPADELQKRFALERYYRCEIDVGPGEHSAIVFAREIPSKWHLDKPLDERASAAALYLKAGPESAAGKRELYFAADRIAWHPDTALGRLGMDYGLFDSVEQMRPITNQERECFYQMLLAAGKAPAGELAGRDVDPNTELGPLFREPQAHFGEPFSFRGVARRAVKIHLSDPDTAARLGFDHYFEVVLFLDLGGVLEVAGRKVGSYPLIYCVRELPPGMPTGDEIGETVRASGFMFKKWPYTTAMTAEQDPGLRVFSPLLIGKTVTWERRREAQSLVGPFAGAVLLALIIVAVCVFWWYRRSERRARAALMARLNSTSDRELVGGWGNE